jgi:hypothetical protein
VSSHSSDTLATPVKLNFFGVIRYISGVGGIALDTGNMLLYLYKEKQPKEKNG